MWVPAGEGADDVDIEVIVPPDDVVYHPDGDPDQPKYCHYSNGNEGQKKDFLSPNYGQHMRGRQRQEQRKQRVLANEEQEDLGFVDLYESDREDGEPDIGPRIRSKTYEMYRGPNHPNRKCSPRVGGWRQHANLNRRSDSPSSSEASTIQPTKRVFHRPSVFVPARYPVKFHKDAKSSATNSRARNAAMRLPPSLSVKTRYGKEAILISNRSKRSALKQWPTPPIYPPKPKVRDSASECHILRLVETLDIGTQNVPIMKTKQCQFGNPQRDTGTQYPRIRKKDIALDPKENPTRCQGIQSVPKTANAMIETTVSVMYHPNIVVREDRGTQATPRYDKEFGWSNIATDGTSNEDRGFQSDSGEQQQDTEFRRSDPNYLSVPVPDYNRHTEDAEVWKEDTDDERDDGFSTRDSFETASSNSHLENPTAFDPGDLSGTTPHLVMESGGLETARELVGLPDSCSEESEDEEEEGEEDGEQGNIMDRTADRARHLPPLSVCGRSASTTSSVQVPVEDD